ncbi:DUF1642 domain-containing protein [Lactiplantibacillus argentoratensis]|uniref:DUF1642 domain-containing protein n=1 Tax=Lactiplantibacillus argentoratensis TaxID=271881 RepID=UPI001B340D00|nr:DUF1642 domain-containing protein [Lactiplantibacillus argentoratensis]MBP5807848.1 DUF1642 domain-containing protein [Lactiplantibacillus argentoratensis]
MIKIYRKTATIKAEQFDGSDEMREKYHIAIGSGWVAPYRINTLEGWVGVQINSWIATGVNGEHWTITDDVFKKSYAELPVIPNYVADWIEKCKHDGTSSIGGMLCYERQPEKVRYWIERTPGTYDCNQRRYKEHQELVARAWLDGYTVEEQA